jgi:hypothetical protein
MTPPAHTIAKAPAQACELVLNVHAYAPPSELAGAVALWCWATFAVVGAVYVIMRAVRWWWRGRDDWYRGYDAGRAVGRERKKVTPLFPIGPAA